MSFQTADLAISMTFLGKIIALFPGLHMLAGSREPRALCDEPRRCLILLDSVSDLYIPLTVFHVHNKIYPLEEGTFSIVKGYSPWFGTHMIQQNFISFKFAEEILRTIPGLFPLWLRGLGVSGRQQCIYRTTFRNRRPQPHGHR